MSKQQNVRVTGSCKKCVPLCWQLSTIGMLFYLLQAWWASLQWTTTYPTLTADSWLKMSAFYHFWNSHRLMNQPSITLINQLIQSVLPSVTIHGVQYMYSCCTCNSQQLQIYYYCFCFTVYVAGTHHFRYMSLAVFIYCCSSIISLTAFMHVLQQAGT